MSIYSHLSSSKKKKQQQKTTKKKTPNLKMAIYSQSGYVLKYGNNIKMFPYLLC